MKKNICIFMSGAIIYPSMEIACRGNTDFSMAIAGGVCLCLINKVCNGKIKSMPLCVKCLAGSAIITSVEFIIGILVNKILKLDVWDYSNMPFNIMGQICPKFSIIWFLLTIPAMQLCMLYDKLPVLLLKHGKSKH